MTSALARRTHNGWIVAPDGNLPPRGNRSALLREAIAQIAREGGGRVEFWIHHADDGDDDEPLACGFSKWRELWQMRCPLPAAPSTLWVRAFTDDDADDFLAVNNRAFEWHPEQGNMTREGLAARQAEPWFDPRGFLLHFRDRRLAGFCWTKLHGATAVDPALGEIYAVAVDPDFHGRGIGVPLTLAGLQWLAAHGPRTGMLYVEHDNLAAVATYFRIGFSVHHADRAYELVVAP
ncbi:MAG: mycothiol synthase [Actinobacteria bacterium]|nr:MAG: mycothiol synthase [Actinomycetota bacterium]